MFSKIHSETGLVYNSSQSQNEMSQGVLSSKPEHSRRHDSVSRILTEGDLTAGKAVGFGTGEETKLGHPFQPE